MQGRTKLAGLAAAGLAAIGILAAHLSGNVGAMDVRSARQEGRVVIYGTAETEVVQPIIASFERRYPGIVAQYQRRDSADTYKQFLSDVASGQHEADIVWSSSMSAQVKLINDGYSQPYASPGKDFLPRWASWKDEGYGITAEALVFAYNKQASIAADMPTTHRELLTLLESRPELLRGRIGLIDPRDNEIAFMGYSQDTIVSSDASRLYKAINDSRPKIFETNRQLLDALVAGEIDFAYNMLGSYPYHSQNPQIRIVQPRDYFIKTSRIAFISKQSTHPAAARLFLDYLLSREAQKLIAAGHLGAIRADAGDHTYNGKQSWPVRVGPSLLADFDQMRRRRLLEPWQARAGAETP